MMNKILLAVFIFVGFGRAWATEGQNIVPDNADQSLANQTFNDEIRKTSRRLLSLEGNIGDINSHTTGILTTDRGGTGKDLSAKTTGSLLYFPATGTLDTIGIGTTGYFLKATGGTPPIGWGALTIPYTAGNYILKRDGRIAKEGSTSFVKHFEIYLPRSGTLRIKFWTINTVSTAHGRIYRNGVAVGTDQSSLTNDGVQFSEDIAGWTAGDLLQLYIKSSAGDDVWVGGLEVLEGTPSNEALDTVTYPQPDTFYSLLQPDLLASHLGKIGDSWIYSTGGLSTTLYVKEDATTWTAK